MIPVTMWWFSTGVLLFSGLAGLGALASPRRALANAVAVLGAGGALSCILVVVDQVLQAGNAPVPGSYLNVDALSALLLLILGIVGLAATLYSVDYLGRQGSPHELPLHRLRRYHGFLLLFLFSMFLTVEANNLGLLWVAMEATTLVSALLVGFYQTKASVEASWKYLILCSVGLVFALFGTILLYLASVRALGPRSDALNWTTLAAAAPQLDPSIVSLSLVFLFVGYGTKAGFAPLHTWLPDAHSEAPTPVSALLSAGLLNCALYALVRVDAITLRMPAYSFAEWLFLGFGLLSVLLAAFFLIVQRDLKRLLAYSSVDNIGIVAVGIGFGGVLGLFGAFFHMVNHAATKATLFLVGGNVTISAGTKDLEEISGVLTALPVTGGALLVGSLALAGVPPFSMFASEFLIVSAGFAVGQGVLVAVLLVGLALVFAGLLSHLVRALLGGQLGSNRFLSPAKFAFTALGVGALLPLVVGLGILLPDPLSRLLHMAVQVVLG